MGLCTHCVGVATMYCVGVASMCLVGVASALCGCGLCNVWVWSLYTVGVVSIHSVSVALHCVGVVSIHSVGVASMHCDVCSWLAPRNHLERAGIW